MTKRTFFLLAFGSLLLFTALAWAIAFYFGPDPLPELLEKGASFPLQILWGSILGVTIGGLAWVLIDQSFFDQPREFFVGIIGPWRLSWLEIIFVSCCAGIGEEILFRGAIQPHLGIVWTSILFVVLHGYISPFNGPLSLYGLFMIVAIGLLGWAAVHFGLVVAMVAHTIIDIILLHFLTKAYAAKNQNMPVE